MSLIKRLLVTLTVLLLFFSILSYRTEAGYVFSGINPEEFTESPYLGDVNADGIVNVSDAIRVLRHVVGLDLLDDPDPWQRADVNLDGVVNVSDAILILRDVVGLLQVFPVVDPAFVSTERAFCYVIQDTYVNTVNLASDIVLTGELVIDRDLLINEENSGGKKIITGTVILAEGVSSFIAQNLIFNGTLKVNTSGLINLDVLNNCDINQADFLSGDVTVTGGGNIRNAWISKNANVTFDEKPELVTVEASEIDKEKSFVNCPDVVTAGTDRIPLEIILKDEFGNAVGGKYKVSVVGDWTQPHPGLVFSSEGRGVVLLASKTEAGVFTGTVYVENILIDTFSVTVAPAKACELFITKQPSGSSEEPGKVEEIIIITRDEWGNESEAGLVEKVSIIASLGEDGIFTEDSVTEKNIGTTGGNGKVTFDNLVINTDKSLLDITIVFYDKDYFFKVTSDSFNVLGFTDIDANKSGVKYSPDNVIAGLENIELALELYDSDESPLNGIFYTTVGGGWHEGPVFFADGHADPVLIISETLAGEYTDVEVFVDAVKIGMFSVAVEPAEAEIMQFAKEMPEVFFAESGEALNFSVIITDEYDNPVAGETVYVYCVYGKDFTKRPFDSGTSSQVTDTSGIAEFNDLVINEENEYIFLIYLDEEDNLSENLPNLWHRFSLIILPADSSVFWKGYDDTVEVEFGDKFGILISPKDGEGNRVSGLEQDVFEIRSVYINTGDPVTGVLSIHNFVEGATGHYVLTLSYDKPAEIEIEFLFLGKPLYRAVPVIISE